MRQMSEIQNQIGGDHYRKMAIVRERPAATVETDHDNAYCGRSARP